MAPNTTSTAHPNGNANTSDPDRNRDEAFADAEPPPAYSTHDTGSTTLEANFARPYEIQDSGMFSQPSGPPPGQQHQHQQQQYPQHSGSSGFSQPPGPPPNQHQNQGQSGSHLAPQLPPRHPSQSPRPPPSPHVDGVSTFNRPALPNQQPAHQEIPAQPARYAPSAHPMSGQPLLHKGKLLIYPLGVSCQKCHNTGYKAYDPSSPHDKCWDKYGKNYNSTVWNSPNFDFPNPSLQRPLPNTRYASSVNPPPPPPSQAPQQSHPGYYQAGQAGPPPPQMMHPPQPPPPQQQQWGPQTYYGPGPGPGPVPQPFVSPMTYGMPPPGAMVVRPGDPRIGGRLCMHCGGDGLVECGFFLLDTETCRACNGTGRVFW